jgi:CRP/FNR family transcriptional regulator, cyclic AMP receptor protein
VSYVQGVLSPAGERALLEVDPELAAGLSDNEVAAARAKVRVSLRDVRADEVRGKWGRASPTLVCLLLVEGALLREVRTARSVTAELLGPGDLIRPFEEDGEEDLPLRTEIRWQVVQPLLLGVIDTQVLKAAAEWPSVVGAIVARCVRRAQRLSVNLSISHMVRADDRLLLLFWHLSERWGRVSPDGVEIDLPLTHGQLASMIGAERPSTTTALSRLADDGLLTRLPSRGWRLSGPVPHDVAALLTRTGALPGRASDS